MKFKLYKVYLWTLLWGMGGLLVIPSGLTQAAQAPRANIAQAQCPKIGFVNTERILHESRPAKIATTKIEKEFKKRDEALQKLAAQLRDDASKFEAETPVLANSKRGQWQRKLSAMELDLQRQRREFQEDFNRRRNEEFSAIVEEVNATIKRIAEEGDYDFILQDAVIVSPRVDITDQVIKALNQDSGHSHSDRRRG